MRPSTRIGFDRTPELAALRLRYEAGLSVRLRALRAALESSRRGREPPLELVRQLRTTAGCYEVEDVAEAAEALEAMLVEGREDWGWALAVIDGLLAAQPTEEHVPTAGNGVGPRIAFVGRDESLHEALVGSAKRAGGRVSMPKR